MQSPHQLLKNHGQQVPHLPLLDSSVPLQQDIIYILSRYLPTYKPLEQPKQPSNHNKIQTKKFEYFDEMKNDGKVMKKNIKEEKIKPDDPYEDDREFDIQDYELDDVEDSDQEMSPKRP